MQSPLLDAIEVPLTKGYAALIDPVDSDLLVHKWHVIERYHKGVLTGVYADREVRIDYKNHHILLHRVVLERSINRQLAKGELVDHINRNTLDNRRSNLRVATAEQNAHNSKRSSANTSGFKGAFWSKSHKTNGVLRLWSIVRLSTLVILIRQNKPMLRGARLLSSITVNLRVLSD